MTDPLVRPVWDALAHRQAAMSIGGDRARRFVPEIGPLSGARDDEPESLHALGELVRATGPLLVVQADPIVVPPGTVATLTAPGVQMIAEKLSEPAHDARIEPLTVDDYPAMLELALLTKPGPFAARTPSLGEFWGIKEAGVLVAMAGERMRHAGLVELSGVCTHPSARGRGYGRILSAWVAWQIHTRGETPYLHAYASNTGAIELYRRLGFVDNRAMHVAAIALTG